MSTKWMDMEKQYYMFVVRRQPVVLVKGKGSRVWAADGKEHLDFTAGWGVDAVGHDEGAAEVDRSELGGHRGALAEAGAPPLERQLAAVEGKVDPRAHAAFISVEAQRHFSKKYLTTVDGHDARRSSLTRDSQHSGTDRRGRGTHGPLPAPRKLRFGEIRSDGVSTPLPSQLPLTEGNPARQIKPLPGEDFPSEASGEPPLETELPGKPVAKQRQVYPRQFCRQLACLRNGKDCRPG